MKTKHYPKKSCIAGVFAAFALITLGLSPVTESRPSKPFRVMATDSYTINVQKNGRIDVNRLDGTPVFGNAMTAMEETGKKAARVLTLSGQSTARFEVRDALGQGKGLAIQSARCEVYLRAYPTQPFLTVQQILTNDTKKAMTISALVPWHIDAKSNGVLYLGPGEAEGVQILENGRLLEEGADYPRMETGAGRSQWNLAAWNSTSNLSLVAGFLTSERALGQITMSRSDRAKGPGFDSFQARCVYDPPVVLAPGERLESEVLYLGVSEGSPYTGIERYAKAMALFNGVSKKAPFLPHGWDSWSTRYRKNINEESMLANLDVLARELAPYGWKHFAIDAGWERMAGDWEADPQKFPHGMAWLAERIHEKGLTAGIWVNPFTVDLNSPVALEHPEWIAPKNARGKLLIDEGQGILDVTAPGALDWVRGLGRKLGEEWGYDALVEADFTYHLLLAEKFHQPNVTGVQALRMGMAALREGFGNDRFIMTTTPHMVNGLLADGIRIGNDCKPVWKSGAQSGNYGAVETLTAAVRRYYMDPIYVMDQDCVFFGHDSSLDRWNVTRAEAVGPAQSLAWLTGAALTGGVVKIGEPFADLSAGEIAQLQKILPVPDRPARPLDLFQEGPPSLWHLALDGPAGAWEILGLFNWDAAASKDMAVSWSVMGLESSRYYTVFEFWNEHFHGMAQGQLAVNVPPASVRLFGLRRHTGIPMLIASNRHFAQGALDHGPVTWEEATQTLSGSFVPIPDHAYTLYLWIGSRAAVERANTNAAESSHGQSGEVVSLRLKHPNAEEVSWSLRLTAPLTTE